MNKSRTVPSRPLSKTVPGPPHLRFYEANRVVAWEPHGILDDCLLDEIAGWVAKIEKVSLPFKGFIDFSRLTRISLQTDDMFRFTRQRIEKRPGIAPVRYALFCDNPVGFGVARLYETVMKDALVQARASRDRAEAAESLGVPVKLLSLEDTPAP